MVAHHFQSDAEIESPFLKVAVPAPSAGLLMRLDVPCDAIGLRSAGFRMHLRFSWEAPGQVSIACRTSPDRIQAASRWLGSLGEASVTLGPGLAPRLVRADLSRVHAGLQVMLEHLRPECIELSPDGTASVFTAAEEGVLERYCAAIPGTAPRLRAAARAPDADSVSPRQREALETAVALGYYDIPHAVTLRGVAAHMGLSLAAASELLRRAEAAVMQGYVDSLALARPQDAMSAGLPPTAWAAAEEKTEPDVTIVS